MKVVEKFVFQLEAQLADRGVTIELSEAAARWLAETGYDEKFGARPLARVIQEHIKKPLADELLFGKLEHGGTVRVLVAGGDGEEKKLAFEYIPAEPKPKTKAKDGEEDDDERGGRGQPGAGRGGLRARPCPVPRIARTSSRVRAPFQACRAARTSTHGQGNGYRGDSCLARTLPSARHSADVVLVRRAGAARRDSGCCRRDDPGRWTEVLRQQPLERHARCTTICKMPPRLQVRGCLGNELPPAARGPRRCPCAAAGWRGWRRRWSCRRRRAARRG